MKFIKFFLPALLIFPFFVFADARLCPQLNRSLYRGLSGNDVSELQRFWASDSQIYPEGLVTGYFGALTEQAAQRFQEKHSIVFSGSPFTTGFGMVGPKTRSKIFASSNCVFVAPGLSVPVSPTQTPPATPTPAPAPAPIAPAPLPSVSKPATPSLDLKANDSDGQITISYGSSATLSWNLSNHVWWTCNKLRDWEGSIANPKSGSEEIQNLISNKVYKLACYVDGLYFEDTVFVNVSPKGETKPSVSPATTTAVLGVPSSAINPDCKLELNKAFVQIGKDAIEAKWTVTTEPNIRFYWHIISNGIDEGHSYGGKTNKEVTVEYPIKPGKYTRYYHAIKEIDHTINYASSSVHIASFCTSNSAVFEVKAETSWFKIKNFFASAFDAFISYFAQR